MTSGSAAPSSRVRPWRRGSSTSSSSSWCPSSSGPASAGCPRPTCGPASGCSPNPRAPGRSRPGGMGAGPDATLRSPCARRRRCGTTVRGGELADPDAQVEIPLEAIDPKLSEAQLQRLRGYGSAQDVAAGDILYGPGDAGYDLVIVDDAVVEILQPATLDGPEEALIRFGPGSFAGELNMLTGQVVSLIARVVEGGHVHRIPPDRFRRLMGEDPELSNLLLETFRARRAALTENAASRGIEIVGSRMDARS